MATKFSIMISILDFLGTFGAIGAAFWYPGGVVGAWLGAYNALLFLYEKFGWFFQVGLSVLPYGFP